MKLLCYCIVTLTILRNFLFASDLESSKFYEDEFGFIKANPSFKIDGPSPTGFRKLLETTESPQAAPDADAKKEKRSIRDGTSKFVSSSEVKEEMVREMNDNLLTNDDVDYNNLDVKLESPNNYLTRIPLIYNEINGQYQGEVGVGTPPQLFSLIFDTASSDLWIRSDKCQYKNSDIGNPGKAKSFKNWLSSSYEKMNSSVDNRYASGRITGVTAMEVVQIGNLTIKNQIIVEALLLQDLPHTHFDGIFGLSPKDDRHYLMSPFYNMILQDLVPAPMFSLYLSDKKSEIIFGGVDPNYFDGEFTFVDTLNKMTDHWRFLFKGVYVDDQELSKRGCLGIIDSGSDFLMGSRELIEAIIEAVDPHKVTKKVQDGYVVECCDIYQLREIQFKTMDNKIMFLTPEEYVKKAVIDNSEFCYTPFLVLVGLQTSDSTSVLCFGSIFLKKYYTQFDVKGNKIGFAHARQKFV